MCFVIGDGCLLFAFFCSLNFTYILAIVGEENIYVSLREWLCLLREREKWQAKEVICLPKWLQEEIESDNSIKADNKCPFLSVVKYMLMIISKTGSSSGSMISF